MLFQLKGCFRRSREMELSNGEKLILVMLAEIYKSQKIKGQIDPDLVLASIFNDKVWGFPRSVPSNAF
jgi:hypothetical protein